jgi:DNA polymerase III delta prime subunit
MNNLWLEKYTPNKITDIIGHNNNIKKITWWLKNFYLKDNQVLPDGIFGSAIIISGIHGIGKSATIKLILEEMNFNPISISSSNIKDNKTISKYLLGSGNFGSNFSLNQAGTIESIISNKKLALIIHDTENITLSTEKNMLIELYKENEKQKLFPIIFLTNEQHSKLISDIKKTCFEMNFIPPNINELTGLINKICTNELINIQDSSVILNIIKFTQYDIRKLIFLLQDLKFTYGTELIDMPKCKSFFLSSQKKDKDIGLFEGTKELLDNYKTIDKCLALYETEKVLLPLMIFENYPRNILSRSYEKGENFFDCASKICNSISMGDVIETNIYTDQNWYLQSLHGFYTCCETTYELSKYPFKTQRYPDGNQRYPDGNKLYDIAFSTDLNKTSIKNINKKNISIIQGKTGKGIHDILVLNKMIYDLLKKEEYYKIRKISKQYKLSAKYLETILKIDKTIEKVNMIQKIKKLISYE